MRRIDTADILRRRDHMSACTAPKLNAGGLAFQINLYRSGAAMAQSMAHFHAVTHGKAFLVSIGVSPSEASGWMANVTGPPRNRDSHYVAAHWEGFGSLQFHCDALRGPKAWDGDPLN